MAKYDIVIKSGTIIDGLRTPRFRCDIGIKDGKIVEISGNLRAADAAEVVDADGQDRGAGRCRSSYPL